MNQHKEKMGVAATLPLYDLGIVQQQQQQQQQEEG
jgi:hypothetical protein